MVYEINITIKSSIICSESSNQFEYWNDLDVAFQMITDDFNTTLAQVILLFHYLS